MRLYSAFTLAVFCGFAGARETASAGGQAPVIPASVAKVQEAVKQDGARVVLVNVWATWCEPCLEEMPDILRAYRELKGQGLRLVLVSADSQDNRKRAELYLAKQGVDFASYLKTGDDMQFINGLDPKWDGTIPASILFDGKGRKLHLWSGKVSYQALTSKLKEVLGKPTAPSQRRQP